MPSTAGQTRGRRRPAGDAGDAGGRAGGPPVSTPLPGVLASLAPVLDHWGYLAVGGLVLIEDFGIPVPGETILIAAAVYAGNGRLNVVAVGLIALAAAVVGDNIGYAIGRFGGHRLIDRYGRYIFLTPARVEKAEAFFTRHGGKIVTVARFIEGLRQANGIIAGLNRMHWAKFLGFNALGAALWVGTWVSVGYLAGTHIGAIYSAVTNVGLYVLIAIAVLIVARIAWHLLRRRRRGGGDGGPPARESTPGGQAAPGGQADGQQAEQTRPGTGEQAQGQPTERAEPAAGERAQDNQPERAGAGPGGQAEAGPGERTEPAAGERAQDNQPERAGAGPGGQAEAEPGERTEPAADAGDQDARAERAEPAGPGADEHAETKQAER